MVFYTTRQECLNERILLRFLKNQSFWEVVVPLLYFLYPYHIFPILSLWHWARHPVRLSASRPWLRHPAPVFCRPRHGSAAPGPQRQKPGPCSRSVAFHSAKPGWPVVAPAGGNVLATPFSLCSNVAPRSHPGARRLTPPFRLRRNRACGHRPHLLGLPRKIRRGISLRETTLCGCTISNASF